MGLVALVGLGIMWALVLVPDVVRRSRTSNRRTDSMLNFSRQLSVLERATPVHNDNVVHIRQYGRPVPQYGQVAPAGITKMTHADAQRRRQDVLTALAGAAVVSFLAILAFGGPMIFLHAVIDLMLVAYVVAMLTSTRRNRVRSHVSVLADYRSPMNSGVVAVPEAPSRRYATR